MSKIAAPRIESISFEALVSLVGSQVYKEKAVGQRSHTGRIAGGKAKHTQAERLCMNVPTTQAVIQVARISVGRKKEVMKLVDGYHRMTEWMAHSCPFSSLVLITHQVETATEDAAVDALDALMRTIDSKAAVKGSSDFFTGAIEDAGLVVGSKAYRQGYNSLSYFKRVIGSSKLTARQLRESVQTNADVHEAMDTLYSHIENKNVMSASDAKRVFHPGVAEAMFHYMKKNGPSTAKTETLQEALAVASETPHSPRNKWTAVALSIGERIRFLSTVTETKRLRAGRNREQFYDAFRDELASSLILLNTVR